MAKKLDLPLLSSGLETTRDYLVLFWDWFGYRLSTMLNIREWYNYIENWVRWVWDFILKHVWENIRPLFESIVEIGKPLWQILFSWGYFFVGFARTHYIFFSYLGGALILSVVGYFTYDYWLWILQHWIFYAIVIVGGLFGIETAFPDILPQMFPNVYLFLQEQKVTIDGETYNREKLSNCQVYELRELLDRLQRQHSHLYRKDELIDALLN